MGHRRVGDLAVAGDDSDVPDGLCLDRDVALSFGDAVLFELTGPFPAVAAWQASNAKDHERELIAGGRYAVTAVNASDTGVVVKLEFVELAPTE